MLADNTLTPEHVVLVAGYEIDWAYIIIEQIHKVALKRSPSILFVPTQA